MNIGQKIRKLRKEAGISQEELAFVLNVSRQTVTRWERGQMTPDTERVAALAKYFGVTADDLINESEDIHCKQPQSTHTDEPCAAAADKSGKQAGKSPRVAIVIGIILTACGILGIVCSLILFAGNGDVTVIYGTAAISAAEVAAVFAAVAGLGIVLTVIYFIKRTRRKKE